MNNPMAPLDVSDIFHLASPSERSVDEDIWARIPVVGGLVRGDRWDRRVEPIVKRVNAWLAKRPQPTLFDFSGNLARYRLSKIIGPIVREEMGWVNDHFVPEDPMSVLLWAHQDGLDAVATFMEIGFVLDLGPVEHLDAMLSPAFEMNWGQFLDHLTGLTSGEANVHPEGGDS